MSAKYTEMSAKKRKEEVSPIGLPKLIMRTGERGAHTHFTREEKIIVVLSYYWYNSFQEGHKSETAGLFK